MPFASIFDETASRCIFSVNWAAWPSGLRRQLQALVRKGASSNLAAVIFHSSQQKLLFFSEERKSIKRTGPVAQWIRHRSTEPEIVGSSPTRISFMFHLRFYDSLKIVARKKLRGGFEPPSLDSKSRVLTVTPSEPLFVNSNSHQIEGKQRKPTHPIVSTT